MLSITDGSSFINLATIVLENCAFIYQEGVPYRSLKISDVFQKILFIKKFHFILDNYYLFIKVTLLIDEEIKYEIIKLICKYIIVFYNIHEEEVEIILFIKNIYNIYVKKY